MLSIRQRFFPPDFGILRQLQGRRRQQAHVIKQLEQLDTFHRAIRPYLCLAQLFGLMPLANVLSSDPQDVRFRLRSSGMCFSLIFLLLGSLKATRLAAKILQGDLQTNNTIMDLTFYISGLIICVNFMSFARCWSRLIQPWTGIDITMLLPPYAAPRTNLRRKLLITGSLILCLSLIEHVLYYASKYHNYRMHIVSCLHNVTEIHFSGYLHHEFADIFDLLPYNIFFVCYAFFLNGSFTFVWNFMDTFIILISIGLSQRFQQFATRVMRLTRRHVSDDMWHELRMHHVLLCELVELIDAKLSAIVLLSCLNNVYFICNQLLNIFTKLRYAVNYAYFWFSLIFLLGRTCAVFLSAARIQESSMLPLQVLHMVPSEGWTEEAQRFMHQLNNHYTALSGYRLFHLTRKSLFGMLSTLIYYEFMLLQLNAKSQIDDLPDLCE